MTGKITPRSFDGTQLQAVMLDLARSVQTTASDTSADTLIDIESDLVFVCPTQSDIRVAYGADPEATLGAGSIPVAKGVMFPLVKARNDKISIIRGGATNSHVDLIPAKDSE